MQYSSASLETLEVLISILTYVPMLATSLPWTISVHAKRKINFDCSVNRP